MRIKPLKIMLLMFDHREMGKKLCKFPKDFQEQKINL